MASMTGVLMGSRGGAVVIALASHRCRPCSNPRLGDISGLSWENKQYKGALSVAWWRAKPETSANITRNTALLFMIILTDHFNSCAETYQGSSNAHCLEHPYLSNVSQWVTLIPYISMSVCLFVCFHHHHHHHLTITLGGYRAGLLPM